MTLELPYVAGIFDGEGYVTINKYHHPSGKHIRYQLLVGIGMVDKPVIEAISKQFGGMLTSYKSPKKVTHRRVFEWRVSSKAAVPFLRAVQPWLIVKRDQVELVLRFQEHITKNASIFRYQPHRREEMYAFREEVLADLKTLHNVSYDL
jgi:hypothetical protein